MTVTRIPFVLPGALLMAVLLVLALVARVCMPRLVGVLVLLLALWNVGGLLSLANIPGKSDAVIFVGTSIYLSCTAILFACLFAEDTVRRIAVLRTGFIFAALLAAAGRCAATASRRRASSSNAARALPRPATGLKTIWSTEDSTVRNVADYTVGMLTTADLFDVQRVPDELRSLLSDELPWLALARLDELGLVLDSDPRRVTKTGSAQAFQNLAQWKFVNY